MVKCSFCEHPLECQACHRPFHPRRGETHVAVYQPDMALWCPECQQPLICRHCGFAYGSDVDEADRPPHR